LRRNRFGLGGQIAATNSQFPADALLPVAKVGHRRINLVELGLELLGLGQDVGPELGQC